METKDITVRILEQIRDELRGTNRRIDVTNERLDRTNTRLDSVENVLVELSTQQAAVVRHIKTHVADDMADLRRRVGAIEARLA